MMTNKEDSNSTLVVDCRKICHVCQKQFAKYTCPRCNGRHCSLQCYKGHNLRCTESFMHENVVEEMRNLQPNEAMKRKMLDILTRFHLEEDICYGDDNDESSLSEQTIKSILSGENIRLDVLSPKELKQFQRAVATGELSKLIEPWEPWWLKPFSRTISLSKDGTQLIKPVGNKAASSIREGTFENTTNDIPAGPETPLPPLSKLCRSEPSPLLLVHLVDILYSYCFTLRLYNGDWHCDSLGAAMVVMSISSVLGESSKPETVAEALCHCIEVTCSPIYKHAGALQFAIILFDDVVSLLSLGNNALICLLCDFKRLVIYGERMLKDEKGKKAKRDANQNKLKHAERKLHFLMCWVHEQPPEGLSCTANLVQMEKSNLISNTNPCELGRQKPTGSPTGKALVIEL